MVFTWCTSFDGPADESGWVEQVEAAWDQWAALATTSELSEEYQGECPDDVPSDWLKVHVTDESESSAEDGQAVFGTGVSWGFPADIASESCDGVFSIRWGAAHAIGHFIGLGHTCEEGSVCVGADAQTAVMYWSLTPCLEREPNSADLALLEARFDSDELLEGSSADERTDAESEDGGGCAASGTTAGVGALLAGLVGVLLRQNHANRRRGRGWLSK